MHSLVYISEERSVEKGLKVYAKSIDPCQPAQVAQADMDRYISLTLIFLHVKERVFIII